MTQAQPQSPSKKTAASLEHLQALIKPDLQQVNQLILKRLNSQVEMIPQIAQHLLMAGGKRLRPVLALTGAKLCGYEGDRHISMATCVELIHTATLLHDDVVDESDLRRGSASANSVWGNQASVLVGDFLLSRAFTLMVEDGSLEVLRILSSASAIIAEGEVLQLSTMYQPDIDEETYFRVIQAKTAELFAAAAELGAEVSEDADAKQPLRNYGNALGIAFQMVDDALDYSASQEALGKEIGHDFLEGKMTLPLIHSYHSADKHEQQRLQEMLSDSEPDAAMLPEVMKLIQKYDGIGYCMQHAQRYCNTAKESLDRFPHSPVKDALLETADFTVQRAY